MISTMMDLADIFGDVIPIPQQDDYGPSSEPATPGICAIAYSPEFIAAHDILRALLRINERSERALALTSVCLKLNPANYTVWHYRRQCLIALSSSKSSNESINSSHSQTTTTTNPPTTISDKRIEMDLDFADKLGGTK